MYLLYFVFSFVRGLKASLMPPKRVLHLKFSQTNLHPMLVRWGVKVFCLSFLNPSKHLLIKLRNPPFVTPYSLSEQPPKHHVLWEEPSFWYINYHRYSFWYVELERMLFHCFPWLWKDSSHRLSSYATLLKNEKVMLSFFRGIKDEIIFDRMTISISWDDTLDSFLPASTCFLLSWLQMIYYPFFL